MGLVGLRSSELTGLAGVEMKRGEVKGRGGRGVASFGKARGEVAWKELERSLAKRPARGEEVGEKDGADEPEGTGDEGRDGEKSTVSYSMRDMAVEVFETLLEDGGKQHQ